MASTAEILNAAFKLTDWLNFFWNFYVAFTAGILGWVFGAKNPWSAAQKVVVSILFVGFVIVSVVALCRTYVALEPTVELLRNIWAGSAFQRAIADRLSNRWWGWQIFLHIVADLIVLYCIWTKTPKRSATEIP